MRTIKLALPDPVGQWVTARVTQGRYTDVSAYVTDLIRRDQAAEQAQATLDLALAEGEASGPSDRTVEDIWEGVKARHAGGG